MQNAEALADIYQQRGAKGLPLQPVSARRSCNACLPADASCAGGGMSRSRFTTSASWRTSTGQDGGRRPTGRRSCQHGSERLWWSAWTVTEQSMKAATMAQRYERLTGEPDALKGACPVREGAVG